MRAPVRRFLVAGAALVAAAGATMVVASHRGVHVSRQVPPATRVPSAAPSPTITAETGPLSPRSPSPVALENRRPGDPGWRLASRRGGGIEGYASRTSVAAGEAITLFVRARAPSFRVDVYRMGWYGGAGARLVARLGPFPSLPQPDCPTLEPRLTVQCAWQPSAVVATGTDWVSGAFLAKLVGADGSDSYVPFVVREATPGAPILVQMSVTTWQAYNRWGGRDLYRGPHDEFAGRSRAVSFDRPYLWPGAGLFFVEYPMVRWLEELGMNVAYATDVDLHEGTCFLERRRVFVSVGHDEYYSTRMRDALEQALARGTSLVFAGANDVYRHIRFEPSPLGEDRVEVNYKRAREDPITPIDPAESTTQWRVPPLSRPEQALLGAQYEAGSSHDPWVPTLQPAWLYRGTGFRRGDRIPGLVGWEHDRVDPSAPRPAGLVLVARSPIVRRGRLAGEADSTFYVAPSGAGVFDAATIWFPCALAPGCDEPWLVPRDPRMRGPGVRVDVRLRRLVRNLLEAMLVRRFA